MVPDKQQKVEIYIMNCMIVLRLLSDPMLKGIVIDEALLCNERQIETATLNIALTGSFGCFVMPAKQVCQSFQKCSLKYCDFRSDMCIIKTQKEEKTQFDFRECIELRTELFKKKEEEE